MANEYGLDNDYFEKKLKVIARDAERYTPGEMMRDLVRLARVAADQSDLSIEILPKSRA